jgi:hypothetical protein
MPSYIAWNSGDLQRWFELSAKKRTRPVRLPALRVRTGKHPIVRLWIGSLELPIQQNFGSGSTTTTSVTTTNGTIMMIRNFASAVSN